jgi:NADPH-dependent curcumin reductase CurA
MSREMVQTTLGALSDEELAAYAAWEATGELNDDGDQILVPAALTEDGRVAASVGEVWCR